MTSCSRTMMIIWDTSAQPARTYCPHAAAMFVFEPFDYGPPCRVHRRGLIVFDAPWMRRVGLPKARPVRSGLLGASPIQNQKTHVLVEVRQLHQDHALDGHQHLQQCRLPRPLFFRSRKKVIIPSRLSSNVTALTVLATCPGARGRPYRCCRDWG